MIGNLFKKQIENFIIFYFLNTVITLTLLIFSVNFSIISLPITFLLLVIYIIFTDSGGLQEEAPSMNVPVLVARDVTERMEGIELGCAKLVGTNTQQIIESIQGLLTNKKMYNEMVGVKNPYGDGYPSQKIIKILNSISIDDLLKKSFFNLKFSL